MDLVGEYRSNGDSDPDLQQAIYASSFRAGMLNDVPFDTLVSSVAKSDRADIPAQLPDNIDNERFLEWSIRLSDYLNVLQDRLFSKGLHVLGSQPSDEELRSYLEAYFGEKLTEDALATVLSEMNSTTQTSARSGPNLADQLVNWFQSITGKEPTVPNIDHDHTVVDEAIEIASLLYRSSEELDSVVHGLGGGYIRPALGGDILRDGKSVLPSGRNIFSLDPYRMPSDTAWGRGQRGAAELLRQHQILNGGNYPETVAVTLWGLDTIKTRGESVAIVLSLVGAEPVKEGTGRVVRYDLVPLEKLGRPRIDVLASLSGIFRDSFANVVDLLDDMFERAAQADEPPEMNFIKKHSMELSADGVVERTAARLFCNP
jgi:magnesium chelatase subunit H